VIRASRIHQVDHRHAQSTRAFLDAKNLLDGARSPRAGLHGLVVGHDGHGTAMHGADAGHHAVRGQVAGDGVGEKTVFDEVLAAVVAQARNALATEQLPRRGVAVVVLLRPALADLLRKGTDVVALAHRAQSTRGRAAGTRRKCAIARRESTCRIR